MHPEFEKLPHFRILEVRGGDTPEYHGVFDSTLHVGEGWHGYLVNESDAVAKGRFFAFDSARRTAVFKPLASTETSSLQAGRSYTYVDGYWGERVELVLDTSERWNRTRFAPQDADVYKLGDKVISGPSGQAPPSPDWVYQRTIKGHWDHEHCDICWQAISEEKEEQLCGYQSDTDKWICEKCYADYVEPRQLSFIDDLAISQIRGER